MSTRIVAGEGWANLTPGDLRANLERAAAELGEVVNRLTAEELKLDLTCSFADGQFHTLSRVVPVDWKRTVDVCLHEADPSTGKPLIGVWLNIQAHVAGEGGCMFRLYEEETGFVLPGSVVGVVNTESEAYSKALPLPELQKLLDGKTRRFVVQAQPRKGVRPIWRQASVTGVYR